MKTKSSIARAMFMKRRALESEPCHFYDGSAALLFYDGVIFKIFLLR